MEWLWIVGAILYVRAGVRITADIGWMNEYIAWAADGHPLTLVGQLRMSCGILFWPPVLVYLIYKIYKPRRRG